MNEPFAEAIANIDLDARVCVYTVSGVQFVGDVSETDVPGRVLALIRPNKQTVVINADHIIAIEVSQ